jgi:tetratricopeptide (TPR) repeat protein
MLAENGIRALWLREGSAAEQQRLALVGRLITCGRFTAAVRHATRLIDEAANYSEAWNQRALAHLSLRHYSEAIRDCHQTLELNPYHFGAAAGMGQAYLELGNYASALEAFRRALQLNPGLEAVRVQVVRLTRLVEGR